MIEFDNRIPKSKNYFLLRTTKSFLATIFVFLFLAVQTRAKPFSSPNLTVELVPECDSIEPGQVFWVGVHFKLKKHWHIYWQNPGDSGVSPRIRWSLPQGFTIGAIQWPYPKKLKNTSLVDFGYE